MSHFYKEKEVHTYMPKRHGEEITFKLKIKQVPL